MVHNKNRLITHSQFGLRLYKGCMVYHLTLISDIQTALRDNKLNLKIHVHNVYEQSQKDMSILQILAYTKINIILKIKICGRKGTDPNTMLLRYKSMIRSKLECCSIIFGHLSKSTVNS